MTALFSKPPVLIGLAIIIILWLSSVSAITVAPSSHAVVRHHEAAEIVKCIENQGPYYNLVFMSRDNKFYIPCLLQDGLIALGIFTRSGDNVTAFVPKDGTWSAVRKYIEQNATRIMSERWPSWLR